MGIYITFYADPQQIRRQEWEAAFADAAKIAQTGRLCEIEEREYEGYPYFPGVPSVPKMRGNGDYGLMACGELRTGSKMETHFFPQSFGVEEPEKNAAKSALTYYLEEPEDYGLEEPDMVCILGNKTQGTPGHMWLLSMACVFCDRFPDAAYLSGDITAEQVDRALRLAEKTLGRTLAAPLAFDMARLLLRARELAKGDVYTAARLYFEIYRGPRGEAFNRFVKESFPRDALYAAFRAKAAGGELHAILKEWLLLGMPFRDAARLLVADPEGPEYEPEDFVWTVLEAKLHVERNPARAAARADERREEPDDVRMQFSRMAALILRLRSRAIDCYIPLERIKADCAEVFGGRCDVEKLFADAEAEMSADKKRRAAEEVCERIWALAGEHEDFDISEMRQMFDWTGDELTRPELLDELTNFYQTVYQATENIREWFFAADRNDRLRAITAHGRDVVLLPQERWDEIFRSLMDNGKMERYITLLGVEPIGDGTVEKLRLLLYNDGLYEEIRRRAFG